MLPTLPLTTSSTIAAPRIPLTTDYTMSLLARSAVPLRQVALRSRAAPVRSMHGEYKVR